MIETIDFSKSEQYTLSIRLSADGFSFSVFSPLGEGGLSFFDWKVEESLSLTANLKQTFREVEWLKHPYRRVNILMADKRFTLVPLEFFEDEQTETLFYHNHPKRENEIVQYNILRKNNVVVKCSFFPVRTISRCKILFAGKFVHRTFLQQKPLGQQPENVRASAERCRRPVLLRPQSPVACQLF